jgi:hypothetical protein
MLMFAAPKGLPAVAAAGEGGSAAKKPLAISRQLSACYRMLCGCILHDLSIAETGAQRGYMCTFFVEISLFVYNGVKSDS